MSHKTNRQIFALPMLLGVSTVAGLGVGLMGDGIWDVAAGLLLTMPLAVTGGYWVRKPMPGRRPIAMTLADPATR
ncbi:MAG TPA: hypothetical protein VNJ10_10360 [Sphingomonas sp.]|nr:hypothetical protein [Sphingomonas sp.]